VVDCTRQHYVYVFIMQFIFYSEQFLRRLWPTGCCNWRCAAHQVAVMIERSRVWLPFTALLHNNVKGNGASGSYTMCLCQQSMKCVTVCVVFFGLTSKISYRKTKWKFLTELRVKRDFIKALPCSHCHVLLTVVSCRKILTIFEVCLVLNCCNV